MQEAKPTRLSKKAIDEIKPTDKDHFVWDDDLAGFGMKITPSGKKVFVLQARLNGQSRRVTIGTFGSPWSPDQARTEALRLLGEVSKGVDPMDAKRAVRADLTIAELSERYWKASKVHKKPNTLACEATTLRRHILPLLGKTKTASLQRHAVQKFLGDVASGKTMLDARTGFRGRAIVKGGQGTANRSCAMLSSMLSYAVEIGLRKDNPAIGIKKFKLKKHDRYLSAEELERIGLAMKSVEDDGASLFAIAAIRFLLLSGCRKNDALTLQWSWIDWDHNLPKLTDSKTGQKNLMLGEGVMDFLKTLPRLTGSPLVFPSASSGYVPISLQKVWNKVRITAGLSDLRLHDLRHNFASSAVSSGQSLYIVGKLLGHTQAQTTQRYAHLASDPVQAAADNVAAELGRKIGK